MGPLCTERPQMGTQDHLVTHRRGHREQWHSTGIAWRQNGSVLGGQGGKRGVTTRWVDGPLSGDTKGLGSQRIPPRCKGDGRNGLLSPRLVRNRVEKTQVGSTKPPTFCCGSRVPTACLSHTRVPCRDAPGCWHPPWHTPIWPRPPPASAMLAETSSAGPGPRVRLREQALAHPTRVVTRRWQTS